MEKWKPFDVGGYRLKFSRGKAAAEWVEGGRRRWFVLDAIDEMAGRAALAAFAGTPSFASTGRTGI